MIISVPIRGLFNLIMMVILLIKQEDIIMVSVPVRGLFNLTRKEYKVNVNADLNKFPSPSGDYLI